MIGHRLGHQRVRTRALDEKQMMFGSMYLFRKTYLNSKKSQLIEIHIYIYTCMICIDIYIYIYIILYICEYIYINMLFTNVEIDMQYAISNKEIYSRGIHPHPTPCRGHRRRGRGCMGSGGGRDPLMGILPHWT